METMKAFSALFYLIASMTAFFYGCITVDVFWIAIAIYLRMASTEDAFQLGWLEPNLPTKEYLSCTKGDVDERNRNENSSTGVQ